MTYNTSGIRELLKIALDDQELVTFCFDYFRPVYDRFAPEMSRLWKIQLLIDYCERHEELDRLLSQIKEINPRQYDRFIFSIRTLPSSEASIDSNRGQIEITIKGNLSDFTPELKSAAIGALARALNIPRERIKLLAAQVGSIILQLEMPKEAIHRLITLYETSDPIMQDLGILQVKDIRTQSHSAALTIPDILQALSDKLGDESELEVSKQHLTQTIKVMNRLSFQFQNLAREFELNHKIDTDGQGGELGIPSKDTTILVNYAFEPSGDGYEFEAVIGQVSKTDIPLITSEVVSGEPIKGITGRIDSQGRLIITGSRHGLEHLSDEDIEKGYMDDLSSIEKANDQFKGLVRRTFGRAD